MCIHIPLILFLTVKSKEKTGPKNAPALAPPAGLQFHEEGFQDVESDPTVRERY